MIHGFQIPGDLALTADGRHLAVWFGADELAARIDRTLRQWRGQWQYDTDFGPDWWTLLGEPTSAAVLAQEIGTVLREIAGVESVNKVQVEITTATRSATVQWEVQAVTGTLAGSTTL